MPNPNPNTKGLIPGKSPGRKPLNRNRINISLDRKVSDRVTQIATNLGTSKPKVIEILVRHALDMYAINGYDKADIEMIINKNNDKYYTDNSFVGYIAGNKTADKTF